MVVRPIRALLPQNPLVLWKIKYKMRSNRSISTGSSDFFHSGWTPTRSQTQSAHGKRPTQMFTFQKKWKICSDDFVPIRNLGEGAYGEVMLVKLKSTQQEYAMKILDKDHIQKLNQEKQVLVEKKALTKLNHPNFVKLHFSFQVSLEWVRTKAISTWWWISLKTATSSRCSSSWVCSWLWIEKLEPRTVRFYAAEIVNMLVYLRGLNLIHRDLKPDNLLLDDNYHLKLVSFNLSDWFWNCEVLRLSISRLFSWKNGRRFREDIRRQWFHSKQFCGI